MENVSYPSFSSPPSSEENRKRQKKSSISKKTRQKLRLKFHYVQENVLYPTISHGLLGIEGLQNLLENKNIPSVSPPLSSSVSISVSSEEDSMKWLDEVLDELVRQDKGKGEENDFWVIPNNSHD